MRGQASSARQMELAMPEDVSSKNSSLFTCHHLPHHEAHGDCGPGSEPPHVRTATDLYPLHRRNTRGVRNGYTASFPERLRLERARVQRTTAIDRNRRHTIEILCDRVNVELLGASQRNDVSEHVRAACEPDAVRALAGRDHVAAIEPGAANREQQRAVAERLRRVSQIDRARISSSVGLSFDRVGLYDDA